MSKKKTLREYQWQDQFRADRRAWNKEYRQKLMAQTTLEQRKIFIESMRESGGFGIHKAMTDSGITDISVAFAVYTKNSRPSKCRHLVEPEKVR